MQAERLIERHGDYLIDVGTGEIVGRVDLPERFTVQDQDSAEWVLHKMQAEDAEIAKLEAIKAAVVKNADDMIRDHTRRRAWLTLQFEGQLKAWAASELEGKKSRTVKTIYGRLSFKHQPARLKVIDPERLLVWAKSYAPDAVKSKEWVNTSEFPAEITASLMESGFPRQSAGLDLEEEKDNFRITTGLEVKR